MADYYGTWKEDIYVCNNCDWKGIGDQCTQGEMFKDLFEVNCPSCDKRVDVILYPTIEDSRANWDKVSDEDKIMILAHEQYTKAAEDSCLQSPEQLPELEGEILILVWDQRRDEKGRDDTFITYGKDIIWRETAFYEGYARFAEVAQILKKKYGNRLKDLIPTERSENYLYGDYLSAPNIVKECRNRLSAKSEQ